MLTSYFRLFFRLSCCGGFCCAHMFGFFLTCCVNFNIEMWLCREGRVRELELEYTVQQDAAVQY
jgi:hypothetical protein